MYRIKVSSSKCLVTVVKQSQIISPDELVVPYRFCLQRMNVCGNNSLSLQQMKLLPLIFSAAAAAVLRDTLFTTKTEWGVTQRETMKPFESFFFPVLQCGPPSLSRLFW